MSAITQASAKVCVQPKSVQQRKGQTAAVCRTAPKMRSLSSVHTFGGSSAKALTATRQTEMFSRKAMSVNAMSAPEAIAAPPLGYKELNIAPGVVTGDDLMKLKKFAKDNEFAIPAVNCTSSSIINSCLAAAREMNSPMIIQFSHGGGAFMAGTGVADQGMDAAVAGCVSGALHVRELAKFYGVPIILHSDHCAKKLLPWFDGMLDANEEYFKKHGVPLFSSHMLDLSEEPIEENLDICKEYLARMSKIDLVLEMELGITGGEEDGVDNSDVDASELYSTPEEIYQVYQALSPISDKYTVAAAFGNVHGVYKPGNVTLTPTILDNAQKYITEKEGMAAGSKPVYFVFHGGSGSSREEIREAIGFGVIKMNIDTDTQWSYWDGVREFVAENGEYLQGQIGNPEGDDKPNKKYYDPRAWMKYAERNTIDRLKKAYEDLNCVGVCN